MSKTIIYYDMPGFEYVYLEDSYVLDIEIRYRIVKFYLEIVLTSEHKFYRPPNENEQYCYKKGIIIFEKVSNIVWSDITGIPGTDADNSIDYGNIDNFILQDGLYVLDGSWGNMKIVAQSVKILYDVVITN